MGIKLRRFVRRDAISTVIGVVISVVVILSSIAVVVTWGIPYIEYHRAKEAQKRATLQFDMVNSMFDTMAYQKSGIMGSFPIRIDKYSSVYSKKNSDRMVIVCSLDKEYNFSVTGLNTSAPNYNASNITVNMTNGKLTHAWVYWLKNSVDLYTPCFASDSLVLMWDGTYKKIEDIEVGDEVVGYNLGKNKIEKGKVIDVRVQKVGSILVINNQLRVTEDHLFYTDAGWVSAKNLKPGTKLLSLSGEWVDVSKIEKAKTPETVYDIEVSDCHNFFVLLNGKPVLVHNQLHPSTLRCSLDARPPSGPAPLEVTFTITIKGGSGHGYYILSFGDGNSTGWKHYSYSPGSSCTIYEYHEYKKECDDGYTAELKVNETTAHDDTTVDATDTETIKVTSGGGGPSPQLEFSPKSYDFGAVVKGENVSTTFEIWNSDTSGGTPLNFQLSSSHSWIWVYPKSGTSSDPSEKVPITVFVNTSNLYGGMEYTGAIHITSNGGDSYFTINITVVENPIEILIPREGEKIRVGETLKIKWANISGIGNKVNITLCDVNGKPLGAPFNVNNPIVKNIPTYNHSCLWKIPVELLTPEHFHPKPYIKVTLNISDGKGNYTLSSPFFIVERFDGIGYCEKIIPDSNNKFETHYKLNGTVVIELYNSSKLFGRVWIIDTDAMVYETSVSSGKYRCISEFGGIIYDEKGSSLVYKPFLLTYTDSTFGMVLDQIIASSPSSVSGSTKAYINMYLGVASQREESIVYNMSIEFYGNYSDAWNDYFNREYPSLCSYHKDGLRFVFQHAIIRYEIEI